MTPGKERASAIQKLLNWAETEIEERQRWIDADAHIPISCAQTTERRIVHDLCAVAGCLRTRGSEEGLAVDRVLFLLWTQLRYYAESGADLGGTVPGYDGISFDVIRSLHSTLRDIGDAEIDSVGCRALRCLVRSSAEGGGRDLTPFEPCFGVYYSLQPPLDPGRMCQMMEWLDELCGEPSA